jgi:phosphoglycolate phosphatase-like HAD superfamily hydrolase
MATPGVLSEAASASCRTLLENAALVFWDFDGVVKESVETKTEGYVRLFAPFGTEVAARVRAHHEANGGVSRYEKIPLYLDWAGQGTAPENVREFCSRFSDLVLQAVIDSPWVPGVREYLDAHRAMQPFVLVTATPLEEIQVVLETLALTRCFREVYGAPTAKKAAIRDVLSRRGIPAGKALMIGDSESDYAAAAANDVMFLLRRTPLNRDLQGRYRGPSFEDLQP